MFFFSVSLTNEHSFLHAHSEQTNKQKASLFFFIFLDNLFVCLLFVGFVFSFSLLFCYLICEINKNSAKIIDSIFIYLSK